MERPTQPESGGAHEGEPDAQPVGGRGLPLSPPVIVGEALVDEFSDGRRVVGGAPLNVAWNLGGFGLEPRFVSALGEDERGARIRDAVGRWGLATVGLTNVPDQSTGVVKVELADGQPSYEIVYPVAFDFLPPPDAFSGLSFLPAESESPLLYLGTLAWRRPESRSVLEAWVSRFGAQRFVDINIREPWFDESIMGLLVGGARYVKLNDEELASLSGKPCGSESEIAAAVDVFRERHGGEVFFITAGSRGAYAIAGDERHFAKAPRPQPLRDTVGAGDAFAATVIAGLLRGEPLARLLSRGVGFAARVCSINGATSEDRSLYQEGMER